MQLNKWALSMKSWKCSTIRRSLWSRTLRLRFVCLFAKNLAVNPVISWQNNLSMPWKRLALSLTTLTKLLTKRSLKKEWNSLRRSATGSSANVVLSWKKPLTTRSHTSPVAVRLGLKTAKHSILVCSTTCRRQKAPFRWAAPLQKPGLQNTFGRKTLAISTWWQLPLALPRSLRPHAPRWTLLGNTVLTPVVSLRTPRLSKILMLL